jgi:hypothetical protein
LEFREVERSDGLKRKRSENKGGGTQEKKRPGEGELDCCGAIY